MADCDIHSWSDLYRQVSWNKTMMWPVYSTFPLAFSLSLSLSLSLHTLSNNTCNTFCMHFYHQCPVPGWHHQWHQCWHHLHSRLTWLGSKEVGWEPLHLHLCQTWINLAALLLRKRLPPAVPPYHSSVFQTADGVESNASHVQLYSGAELSVVHIHPGMVVCQCIILHPAQAKPGKFHWC